MFFQQLLSLSVAAATIAAVQGGYTGSLLDTRALLEQRAIFEKRAASRLIVTLKDGATPDSLQTKVPIIAQWDVVPGFLVNKEDVSMEELLADPSVLRVEEDSVSTANKKVTQDHAPWGLERLCYPDDMTETDMSVLDYEYYYDERAGENVNIYVVDSGVRISHNDFEGRASHGATFGGYDDNDNYGHGTHVAGIAAGKEYGVAKKANIIAVKVLDGQFGSAADMISGLDWINNQTRPADHKTVVNFSLSISPNSALDQAVRTLIGNGIHVVVSAGNDGKDASKYSPGRVSEAITVGATNITDHRDPNTNYGTIVDIYAPGVLIASAGIRNDDALDVQSGTSQAAPHVAGLIAYLISVEGQRSPDDMKDRLTDGMWSYSVPIVKNLPTRSRKLAQNIQCNSACFWNYWVPNWPY